MSMADYRTRICVKNLPKYVAEDRLRDVFSQKGEITDAKLMRTKDGKSRQFAFIGFRTEHEAQEAIKYFNKSYLDTSRLICEIAHKVGDPTTPRPFSRHSLKKQEKLTEKSEKASAKCSSTNGVKGEKKNNKKSSEIDDPQLKEFLEVMQPRIKSKMWANDMLISPATDQKSLVTEKETVAKEGDEKVLPGLVKSNETKIVLDRHETEKSEYMVCDDVISDMDYLKSRVRKDWSDSERGSDVDSDNAKDDGSDENNDDHDGSDDDNDDENEQPQHHDGFVDDDNVTKDAVEEEDNGKENLESENPQSSLKDDRVDAFETGRLFVRNLPYTATEDELHEHFSKYGDISNVHLVVDKETKRSKGIAYILYTVPESAARALEELDNSIFQGRLLHVMPAKLKESSDKQVLDASVQSKTFKKRREEERKASEASGDTKSWNTLYMRSDTVVEYIARKHGVSKSDFFDRESSDAAVRVALGEAQAIADTKKALINAGVNVTSLEQFAARKTNGMKRSNHVLLVRHLPYASSENELAKMFGRFGSLDKVILPPTRTMALVVFLVPSEARAAWKGLAYTCYKDAPLFLEWAPDDILTPNTVSEKNGKKNEAVGEHDVKRMILEQQVKGIADVEIDPDRIESRSLYVKNLSFKTSDESLKQHFTENMKEGKILSVKITKHLKNGKNVSAGYGFIEFDSVETATKVCKDLQGTVLDGHALGLQFSHARASERVGKNVDKSSAKLAVKNVPFEATEKDLRQLFSPFGQIKTLRLPKRLGRIGGFAFVEYVTKQEAQNALQALSSTHFYGRHLIIEWANEKETLEDLREKTAAKFNDTIENPTKVSKKRRHMELLDESRMKFERIAK